MSDPKLRQGRSLLDRIADWLLILSLLIIAAIVVYNAWIFFMLWTHGLD